MRVWLCGGEIHAPKAGAACLAGRMLDEGTMARDWRQVAAAAEDRGIAVSAAGGYEALGLALDGPAGELGRMIGWAAELALTPRFDAERWAWQRELAQAELAALGDEPEVRTGWTFLHQLYGAHARGRPPAASVESLDRLQVEDSRRFHRRAAANGVVIAVAGAIDEERAAAELLQAFDAVGDLVADELEEHSPAHLPAERVEVALPGDQAHLFLGRRTVARGHRDLPALELAAVVLGAGAGLAGRIPFRVREREGLAYTTSVDTAADASRNEGRLVLYAATSVDRLDRAERALREELERFVLDGATEQELSAARSYLEGQDVFRRESARQWAELLVDAEYSGEARDSPHWAAERWAGVTRDGLQAAAERWLDPDELVATVGLPGEIDGSPRAAC